MNVVVVDVCLEADTMHQPSHLIPNKLGFKLLDLRSNHKKRFGAFVKIL